MKEETINIGDNVNCDICNESFDEGDTRTGGFTFAGKAVCPLCKDKQLVKIKKYHEEQYIEQICPDDMPFRDWVINVLRDGKPGKITITTY